MVKLEERSDDALCRAPAVPGILPRGKIVEGEKAAGEYEGAGPPVLNGSSQITKKPRLLSQGIYWIMEAEGRPRGSGGLGPQ